MGTLPASPTLPPLRSGGAATSVLSGDADVVCLVLTQLAAEHHGWSAECERCGHVCQLWRACARRTAAALERWSEHTFTIPRFSTRRWPRRARTMEQGEVRPSPPLVLPPFTSNGAHDWQLAVYNPAVDHRLPRRPALPHTPAGKGGLGKGGGLGGSLSLGAGASADARCLGVALRAPSAAGAPPDWVRRVEAYITVRPPPRAPLPAATVHLRQMLGADWGEVGPAWCVRASDLDSFLLDDCLTVTVAIRVTRGAASCELGNEAHPLRRCPQQRELDGRGCHYVCDACGGSSLDQK